MSTRRLATAGLLLTGLVTAGAFWLIGRLEGEEHRAGSAGPALADPAPPPAAPPAAQLTPPEIADPVAARALEVLIERRAAYQAMVVGFKGPASAGARARLEPALVALWPRGGKVSWTLACRGEVCQVEAAGPPGEWQAALAAHPAVQAVTDRIVVDPDGARPAAYLVLAPERSGPGARVLDAVVRQLEEAGEAAACLRGAPGVTVELELTVDATGVTFRAGGDATPEQRGCVAAAVGDVLGSTQVDPGVRTATRVVALRAGP